MGGVTDLGSVTEFLASLSPTGPAGFEGLVARLCEAATGQRFRLSGSGQQSGQDARAEPGTGNRIKLESKRYGPDTPLSLRELTSELTQATMTDPALDLWVLAASRSINDQIARSLEEQAGGIGVEVLFLDMGTDRLPRLAVLMAAYVSEVQEWTSTHCLPEPVQLVPALTALAADASYSGTRAQIQSKLAGTMLGYENARRRCKASLNDVLSVAGKTLARFGQRLDIRAPGSRIISRTAVSAQLDRCQGGPKNRAVVLGEEGTGKTWAVMDWLVGATEAADFPLALAFSAKVEPISGSDTLATLVPRLLAGWTGIGTEAFWIAKLKRWAAAPDTGGPRLMVVCDGLSERALNWPLFFRALEDPQWAGLISVILTDRPEHWRSVRSGMFGYCEIQVDGYDERELHHALEAGNVQLEEIPPDLHPLIRKPRYCDLVCEHFEEMKRESDFTVGRLIWMDVKYRRESKLGFPMSEDDFVAVIQGIAKRHRTDALFDLDSVKHLLPCPDPDGQIYREILDGLLERRTGVTPKFYAKEAHLVFGLGMLIADEVREAAGTASSAGEISDQIGRWFEPHHEMDLKVKICEAALFHAFLDSEYPSAGREEFLRHWLRLRNTTASAQEAFAKYVVRGPKEFIHVAEGLFAEEQYMGAAEDFFVQSFCGNRDEPSVGPVLARAIDRWLRQIHPCGDAAWSSDAAYREKERDLISERIGREACAGPIVIAGEQLVFIEEHPTLRLAGLAFKVISKGARTPFLSSLAAWALGAAIAGSSLMKEFGWLLRLSEDDIATRLIAHAATLLKGSEEVAHVAAHILLDAIGTEEAGALAESRPLPESEFEQRLRLERGADPCTSWLPWSDDDCLRCMERSDVGVVRAIHEAGSRIFDLDYPVPSSLLQRAVALLDEIPRSIHSGAGQTLQDHNFNQISPLLESRESTGLGPILFT